MKKGYTLVEMLIVVVLTSLIGTVLIKVFIDSLKAVASTEVHNSLKTGGQQAVNELKVELVNNKRLFENTTIGRDFLERISTTTSDPPPLIGSRLPIIWEPGTITALLPGSVGNSLFFGAFSRTEILNGIKTGDGTLTDVEIDLYHFNHYYLGRINKKFARSTYCYRLYRWGSIDYANWWNLERIRLSDNIKYQNTLNRLFNQGIRFVWDPSTSSVTGAFYEIVGNNLNSRPNHTIQRSGTLTGFISEIKSVGMSAKRYAVAFNSSSNFNITNPVPRYTIANLDFPGGFEILVVGFSKGRQMLLRLVLAADCYGGAIIPSHESVVIASVPDNY